MPGQSHHFYKHTLNKKEVESIDRLTAVAAVFMPLTALPQVWLLYSGQDASGLSLAMWVLYSIGTIPFLLYGIVHKFKQIIALNFLWLIMQAVMIVGILVYR